MHRQRGAAAAGVLIVTFGVAGPVSGDDDAPRLVASVSAADGTAQASRATSGPQHPKTPPRGLPHRRWHGPGAAPMPRAEPRSPGPVPIPVGVPRRPGPVPIPLVEPDGRLFDAGSQTH